jgi:uncharacterized protein DUF4350
MPGPLESGDRKFLIAAGLLIALLMVVGVLFSPPPEEPSRGYPSSYSAGSDGAKAAYLLLAQLGYKVERWEQPPGELPQEPPNTILILAEPRIPASAEEKWQIRRFILKGGRVLAIGGRVAALLPESDFSAFPMAYGEARKFQAQLPGPITQRAPEIELESELRWGSKHPRHLTDYADARGAVVASYRAGHGEIIWWADANPLTNYGLNQASNLALFLNSVGPRKGARILWDEYFHGERPSLESYLARTPAPWVLLQFLLFSAAALFTYSRRSGPLQARVASSTRLSPLEFVETLGDLYRRKRACAGALEIAYHRFRFLLVRRLGLPSNSTKEALWRGAHERLGCQDQEFFKLLQRCEIGIKGPGPTEAETVQLIQRLHVYAELWRLVTKPAGE